MTDERFRLLCALGMEGDAASDEEAAGPDRATVHADNAAGALDQLDEVAGTRLGMIAKLAAVAITEALLAIEARIEALEGLERREPPTAPVAPQEGT